MVTLRLNFIALIVFTVVLFVCISGHHVSFDAGNFESSLDDNVIRTKREIEDFDTAPDDFQTGTALEEQQEESGFWDRVVKVALKLFSRFIEWLNT